MTAYEYSGTVSVEGDILFVASCIDLLVFDKLEAAQVVRA